MNGDPNIHESPEQGEIHEATREEFEQAMQNGAQIIGIQRVTTGADGEKTATTVYGSVPGQEGPRPVNAFGSEKLISFLLGQKIKACAEGPARQDFGGRSYVMSFDWTTKAITCVLTVQPDHAHLDMYARDMQKSNSGQPVASDWTLTGGLEYDIESLRKNSNLALTLVLNDVYCAIEAAGLVEAAREASSGAMVVALDDEVHVKVVSGRNRPTMPCKSLFFEQMARPYLDEALTYKDVSGMSPEELTIEAENGSADAMQLLGMVVYLRGEGAPQDFEKAAHWMQKLAETDNAIGQFNLGLFYAKGCGVPRSFEKAAMWMRRSAENGDDDAPDSWHDYTLAMEAQQKAEAGDAQAQAELGRIMMVLGNSLDEFGPGHDYEEAFRWAKKSADQGNAEGLYLLGLCYEHGRGTPVLLDKAAQCYERAANKDFAPAQWNLAVCYMNGNGVARSDDKFMQWAYRAADAGYELAREQLHTYGRDIPGLIDHFSGQMHSVMLEGTQYEGRADRCESMRVGEELQMRRMKNVAADPNCIEYFRNGASVGVMSRYDAALLAPLIDMGRISVKARVISCVPKSQRGARARNAEVKLSLSITEIKPETPEERQKRLEAERKAAEERRAAEEKRRQEQAEARRRAQEEARQRAEEEARQLRLAMEQYEKDHAAWEAEVAAIQKERDAQTEAYMTGEKARLNENIRKTYEDAVAAAKGQLEAAQRDESTAQTTLAGLGIFKFGEKKRQKAAIEEAQSRASAARAALTRAEDTQRRALSDLPGELSRLEKRFRDTLNAQPLPAEPENPQAAKARKEAAQAKPAHPAAQPQPLDEQCQWILEVLARSSQPMTVTMVMAEDPRLSALSNQRVFSKMELLVSQGKVKKTTMQRKSYFELA